MKGKAIVPISAFALAIAACFLWFKWDAIFQRGDPLPYLAAALQLSEEKTYAAVPEREGVFLSKRGEYRQLFADFEEENGVTFLEQAGSGYFFANGEKRLIISSEIYWGKYQVWLVP